VVLDDPGQNGTARAASVAGTLSAQLLRHFAVIVMDVRGTGNSISIDCVSATNSGYLLAMGADPRTPAAAKVLAKLSRTLTFDCGDLVGPDLSSYSSTSAADDIDTIRSAIGVPQIALIGRGFGATLGAVYADRYPGRLTTAVLDGPSDPAVAADKRATVRAAAAQQALMNFATACQSFDGGCPLGADPVGAVHALVSTTGDNGNLDSHGQQISGGSIVQVLIRALGSPTRWPLLATALVSAQRHNYDPIGELLLAPLGTDNPPAQQAGALVYRCNDSAQRLNGGDLSGAVTAALPSSSLFGPFLISLVGLCSSWPAPEAALGPVSAAGAPPILVVGAVDDPVAPMSEVRSLTAQLGSAVLLTWASGAHGAYPTSTCIAAAVDAYLITTVPPAASTLCPP